MRRLLIALVLLSAACRSAAAPDPAIADIDRFLQRTMTEFPEVPSIGVTVVRDGKTVLARGYGFRDRERRIAADENTHYYIGSSTKSFTGMLAAMLASRGVIDLDAPVSRYLPELTGPAASVPLRAWLSHTSGLENGPINTRTAFSGEHTSAQIVSILGRSKPIEKKFAYDNLGYIVAGLVFERVTGKTWQQLLAGEVFAPLGMSRTTTSVPPGAATPYDLTRELKVAPLTFGKIDATMHAAGGIFTTPRDLGKWLEANIDRRGLPAAAFAEALKQQTAIESNWYRFSRYGYGLGWWLSKYENDVLIHHFGIYEGWRTHVSFMPERRHGVAILLNTSGTGAGIREVVAAYVYDRLLGKPDLDAKYTAELAKVRQRANEQLAGMRADIEKRQQRPPSLTRAASAYAGTYTNEAVGRLTIREDGTVLRASLGQLSGTLEPFTQPDTARVELIPGSGQVLKFEFAGGDRADAIQWDDQTFRRETDAMADIDRFIRRAMAEFPEVPSYGVAVVREGKSALVAGYGFRDREQRIAADGNTVYYIGSSTKSYTGLLAAVLASRGVVDLDAPIGRYLPEVTGPAAGVPLRAWLSHTSGIDNSAVTMRTAFTGEHTPAQLVSILSRSRAVEKTFEYDNLGYVVAGLVFERVTGKSWQDLLAAEVFAPLGMTRTTAYISRAAGWPLAKPYDFTRQSTIEPLSFVKIDRTMHAAGGIVTTPRDLAKWLEANIDRRGLPAAAFTEAQKQQTVVPETSWYRFRRLGYGFGWYQSDYENEMLIHHFGGYEGWRTHVSFLPKQRHGVAIATNTGATGAGVRDIIAAYIYDRLLGKPDLEVKYTAELAKARKSADDNLAKRRVEVEKLAQRPPSLTRAASTYAGTYVSENVGRLTIRAEGSSLRASLGQLRGTLEPYTEPESARVELIPGSGQVLRFTIGADGRAEAVKMGDHEVFRRE